MVVTAATATDADQCAANPTAMRRVTRVASVPAQGCVEVGIECACACAPPPPPPAPPSTLGCHRALPVALQTVACRRWYR